MLTHPFRVADTASCPYNLHIACLQWTPFLHFGIIMPYVALQHKRANFKSLVRVQAYGAVFHCPGMRPIKQIGIRADGGLILGKTDGFVFYDFAAIESAFALLLDGYDLDGHFI
jgi:hypothetical protein